MVTKEQAMTCTRFKQVKGIANISPLTEYVLSKPLTWRANGKCKTWKRDLERFSLPVKHGLYSYGYLTDSNANLFEVEA